MKLLTLLLFTVLSTFVQAKEISPTLSQTTQFSQSIKKGNEKTLESVGRSYMDLLNRIGTTQSIFLGKDVLSLCAPICKKIVNGAVWFEDSKRFIPQLLSTGHEIGAWHLEPLDIISGKDGRTVVVRFLVHTEKAGVWNTFVLLRCNEELLITEINEVYNSYEGAL